MPVKGKESRCAIEHTGGEACDVERQAGEFVEGNTPARFFTVEPVMMNCQNPVVFLWN